MIIKLLKPVPMINRVVNAGEFLDSEKVFVELVQSGWAAVVEGKLPEAGKNDAGDLSENPAADKSGNETPGDGGEMHVLAESKPKRTPRKKAE